MSDKQKQLFGYEKRADIRKRRQSRIRDYVQFLVDQKIAPYGIVRNSNGAPSNIKELYSEVIADLHAKYL